MSKHSSTKSVFEKGEAENVPHGSTMGRGGKKESDRKSLAEKLGAGAFPMGRVHRGGSTLQGLGATIRGDCRILRRPGSLKKKGSLPKYTV